MEIYKKLFEIQQNLKAPKGQYNSFGNYKYRSAEDILEAVKPHLAETKTVLVMNDEIRREGCYRKTEDYDTIEDYMFIRATATLYDTETGEHVEASAWAKHPKQKKGMDDSQVTGTASSYARKYALNGLFAIDDTKDADALEPDRAEPKRKTPTSKAKATETPIQPSTSQKQRSPKLQELFDAMTALSERTGKTVAELAKECAAAIGVEKISEDLSTGGFAAAKNWVGKYE